MVQACHFNGQDQYDLFADALNDISKGRHYLASERMLNVLRGIHGHNFQIIVTATGEFHPLDEKRPPYLVDDVKLTEMVMAWDNQNLSVLEDFTSKGLRATTENMVSVLLGKLKQAWPMLGWSVRVEETPSIFAVAGA